MSVNHASMTTQSLPSFAQAFSTQSLSSMNGGNNALPPIHHRTQPMDSASEPPPRSLSRPASDDDLVPTAGRKRPHNDIVSASRDDAPSDLEYVFSPYFPLLV